MSHETTYITWNHKYSENARSEQESCDESLARIEREIFSYICMSPDKIRSKRAKKDCDDGCQNNAQYLAQMWDDLLETWHELHSDSLLYGQLANAVEEGEPVKIEVCPDCMRQVHSEYEKGSYDWHFKCPKCGKVVDKPILVEIDRLISEG